MRRCHADCPSQVGDSVHIFAVMHETSGSKRDDVRRWADYVRDITHGDNGLAIQARSGVHQSTISRWYSDTNPQRPSAVAVVAIARAYGANVVESLVAAGFVSDDEAKLREARPSLRGVETSELMRELARRTGEKVA